VLLTAEACETGTVNKATATRNNQAIFFFIEISSRKVAMRVEKRRQINPGNRNSDRRRKFAQDTKHEGFQTTASRNYAHIYVAGLREGLPG
jgi:hypothetical protein